MNTDCETDGSSAVSVSQVIPKANLLVDDAEREMELYLSTAEAAEIRILTLVTSSLLIVDTSLIKYYLRKSQQSYSNQ